MDNSKIVRLSSITKKLLVALFATFLLVFLLMHMTANLFILKHDEGAAYSAFCHFMGTNMVVKVFEVILMGCLVMHLGLSSYLWFCNRRNRPVRYHQPSKTKTAKGSKLAMITGSLLLVCLVFHFYDFYMVKIGWVEGTYMVKCSDLDVANADSEVFYSDEDNTIPSSLGREACGILDKYSANTIGDKWYYGFSKAERKVMETVYPEAEFEPDFYHRAHQKFSVWHIVLGYLVFFAVVGIHIRHGFESAFQTFGLNHYKYSRLIQILGIIYTWVVCVGFSIVPLGVLFGL